MTSLPLVPTILSWFAVPVIVHFAELASGDAAAVAELVVNDAPSTTKTPAVNDLVASVNLPQNVRCEPQIRMLEA